MATNPTDEQILNQFSDEIIEGVKEKLRITQSDLDTFLADEGGKSSNSLRKVVNEKGTTIYGYPYIGIAERGRAETVNPGDGALRRAILRWIQKYNIKGYVNSSTGREFTQAEQAYFRSRSIHEGGTQLYKRGGDSGVLSDIINQERIDGVVRAFATKYANKAKSEVLTALQ